MSWRRRLLPKSLLLSFIQCMNCLKDLHIVWAQSQSCCRSSRRQGHFKLDICFTFTWELMTILRIMNQAVSTSIVLQATTPYLSRLVMDNQSLLQHVVWTTWLGILLFLFLAAFSHLHQTRHLLSRLNDHRLSHVGQPSVYIQSLF